MYKISKKKGQVYELDSDLMKLNWRCKEGTVEAGSFKCGNTPEEAKKNYNKQQKEKKSAIRDKSRTQKASKGVKVAEKKIKKIFDPELKTKVDNLKSIIDKVKAEKKSGKVSKETYKALQLATKELKTVKESSKSVPKKTEQSKPAVKKESNTLSNTTALKDQVDQLSNFIKQQESEGNTSSWGDQLELDNLKGKLWIEENKSNIGNKFDLSKKDINIAIRNTSGAKITKNGLQLSMARYQNPDQAGKLALRDGIFYLPTTSGEDHKLYTDPNTAFGGSQKVEITSTFKNPLMVLGSTGGSIPERAYKAIAGEKKFEELDKNLWNCQSLFTGFKDGKQPKDKVVAAISEILKEYGGNPDYASKMYDAGWAKRADGGADPVLYFTMREHIFGHAAKEAGYDSIIGYDGVDEKDYTLTEVFDLTSSKNPVKSGQKLNMNLGTFSTSQDLDSQLDDILKGIEPIVLKSLRKTAYFDKEGDQ